MEIEESSTQLPSGISSEHLGPLVAVVGNADRAEMRALAVWLTARFATFRPLVCAPDITSLFRRATSDEYPDLIVVLQSWSDEHLSSEVDGLFAFAPLARIIVCYGAWCESDGRNRNLWPTSVRVPVWAAEARIDREWSLLQDPDGRPPLPWSASREEVFAADHPPIIEQGVPQTVLIDSPDLAYGEFLCEMIAAEGHTLVRHQPTVLLFDADPWGPIRAEALETIRNRYPTAEIIALLSQIQPLCVGELRCLGVTNVSAKLPSGPAAIRRTPGS